ncbi:MAG: RnfABCDGE type electron transport complex subunit B [Candidatus Omnitrophota bacterium]
MREIIESIKILGGTGLIFAVVLAFFSKILEVKDDPRIEEVLTALPGINCGACGFSGCRVFAEAVVKEGKIFNGCLPGGKDVDGKIAAIIGVASGGGLSGKKIVVCLCGAAAGEKKMSHTYLGPMSCKAAAVASSGIDCRFGCIGLDDCVAVCPVGAIRIENKKVYVDGLKCIACGRCISACPRRLFEFVELQDNQALYYVGCNNNDKAVNIKRVCSRGCIGCGLCAKVENAGFYLDRNLARVDRAKAADSASQEQAQKKCPAECIYSVIVPKT